MHTIDITKWKHTHQFSVTDRQNENRTLWVVLLTASMMGVEIISGLYFGSMALVADGWHMSTHATALGISLFTYIYARRHNNDPHYTFGTGKVNVLGGFTSAVILLVVALLMIFESTKRFFSPQDIRFDEAIFVALLGLIVNLGSALLLKGGHAHHHHPAGHKEAHHHDEHSNHAHAEHEHAHPHDSGDLNLKAAYLHVLADALTSFLAIFALLAGKTLGWIWMDASMGIVGALIITKWSIGLLRETSCILLDQGSNEDVPARIRSVLEAEADNRVTDLHVWRVGSGQYAAIISLVTSDPQPVEHYKGLLNKLLDLAHLTVEVNLCTDELGLVSEA